MLKLQVFLNVCNRAHQFENIWYHITACSQMSVAHSEFTILVDDVGISDHFVVKSRMAMVINRYMVHGTELEIPFLHWGRGQFFQQLQLVLDTQIFDITKTWNSDRGLWSKISDDLFMLITSIFKPLFINVNAK